MSDAERPISRGIVFRSTGYEGSTFTQERMLVGPCDFVDPSLIELLKDATQTLYAVVSAARTLKEPAEESRGALQHILVASGGIAATEAEALLTLCSIDLCAPARIHARALGDVARRFLLLPRHQDVALEMYNFLKASQKQMLIKIPTDHPARAALELLFETADGRTMEVIERNAYSTDVQSDDIFMSVVESKQLSKWSHADIVALAQAGERILASDARLRTSLAVDPDANLMIHRATGKVLAITFIMEELFHIGAQDRLDKLFNRHSQFAQPFRERNGAIKAHYRMAEASPLLANNE